MIKRAESIKGEYITNFVKKEITKTLIYWPSTEPNINKEILDTINNFNTNRNISEEEFTKSVKNWV